LRRGEDLFILLSSALVHETRKNPEFSKAFVFTHRGRQNLSPSTSFKPGGHCSLRCIWKREVSALRRNSAHPLCLAPGIWRVVGACCLVPPPRPPRVAQNSPRGDPHNVTSSPSRTPCDKRRPSLHPQQVTKDCGPKAESARWALSLRRGLSVMGQGPLHHVEAPAFVVAVRANRDEVRHLLSFSRDDLSLGQLGGINEAWRQQK